MKKENIKYKIFIDDTGSKKYHDPYNPDWKNVLPNWKEYRDYAERNFFVLTAVIVDIEYIGEINLKINRLKEKYFKTKKVEIKSVNLRNNRKQYNNYLKPFKLKIPELRSFIDEYYQIINKYSENIKILSIVFNKMAFKEEKRKRQDGNPFLKTSQALFDRITFCKGKSILVIDQMEKELSASKGKNGEMNKVYLGENKFEINFVNDYSSIKSITFQKSSNDNFLQMADICGYNIFRQFVDQGFYWGNKKEGYEIYDFLEKIIPNIRHDEKNSKSIGIVLLGGPLKSNLNGIIAHYKNKKSSEN